MFALFSLFFLISSLSISFSAAKDITAIKVINDVKLKSTFGFSQTVVQNQSLSVDDTVSTGPKSLASFQLRDESKIQMGPKATLTFNSIHHESTKNSKSKIFLKIGATLLQVPNPQNNEKLILETKNVSIGVRGTIFYVGYQPVQNRTWVAVVTGSVWVRSNNSSKYEVVHAGESIVVKDDDFPAASNYSWGKKLTTNSKGASTSLDIESMARDWLPSFRTEKKPWIPPSEGLNTTPKINQPRFGMTLFVILLVVGFIAVVFLLTRKSR